MTKVEIVDYTDRAKNVVFIFSDDEIPSDQMVYQKAIEPQREIAYYKVNNHQEVMIIYRNSPTAWQHFVTRSVSKETIEFLNPVILGNYEQARI
jgi:hypothetical protein